MANQKEPSSLHVYDNRLASYESFFDHGWLRSFDELANKTRLMQVCFDLGRDWKGTALVYRTSWLMIHSLNDFHAGYVKENPGFAQWFVGKFIDYVTKYAKIRNMAKRALLSESQELRRQVQEEMARSKPIFDIDKVWNEYLQIKEFILSLTYSQGMAYSSIYYAYENFLQRCVEIKRSDDAYRARNPGQLSTDFSKDFGIELEAECITSQEVLIARLVRNCLAHNGGRVSADLLKHNHGFQLEDDRIVIMPEHVKGLFDALKAKAVKVVEAAVRMPDLRI